MPEQLALRYSLDYRLEEAWARICDEFALVVHHVTPKAFCYAVDCQPSHLSHAMKGTERHHIQGKWLVYAIAVAPNRNLANAVLALAGLYAEAMPKNDRQRVIELEAYIRANELTAKDAREKGLIQ